MKLKRIISLPFAMMADVVTLGKMGEGSFTQDVFDAERREVRHNQEKEAARLVIDLIKAINK